MPGTTAEEAELVAVADAMRRSGSGVIQAILSETIAKGHQTQEAEVEMLCRLSAASGRPGTFTLIQKASQPDRWRELVDLVKQRNAAGSQVHPQVGSRPAGLVFSLASYHPFMTKPSYVALKHLPFEQRLAAMRDPEVKARILSEPVPRFDSLGKMENNIAVLKLPMERTFALDANFTYEPSRDESFEALAQKAGYEDGLSYFYDYLVSGDGRNFAMTFFSSYGRHNLNHIYEMQLDDTCVVGLSDGGAHVGLIFDAVAPTYQLTYWARDRRRGETLPLEHVIHKQTRRNAELFGFKDRGALAPGMRADVNVIDFENLRLGEIQFHHDLPGGGSRLLQGASGYLATMVNGQVTRRHDADTGARPGRLLRGEAA
jgi:N-acyl-D-aspartate/D-glutamate deacylase